MAVDPTVVQNRAELGAALTELRAQAGLTIRDVVEKSGSLHGTVSGWFSGQHVPTKASLEMFEAVLAACGVTSRERRSQWREAAQRARSAAAPLRGGRDGPPYKGLDAFQRSDADTYFGRTALVEDILGRLADLRGHPAGQRALAVLGASGSGKSSLLRAGVAAGVAAGKVGFEGWSAVVLTPGDTPRAAVVDTVNGPGAERTVVVVDQFEELWSQCRDPREREDFVDALLAAPGLLVLGLRADFYGEAAKLPGLRAVLGSAPVLLGPMGRGDLREVVCAPAAQAGVAVDEDLVEVLLEEFAPRDSWQPHDDGALPLLSHALLRTWEVAKRRRMTLADYRAAGGLRGAVRHSAEDVYAGLDERQRVLACGIFTRMVTVDGPLETRRRLPVSELAATGRAGVEVVERFAAARLVTVHGDYVEIAHEALLLAWPRLREWVEQDRAGLVTHRGLTLAAQVWADSGRDSTALLGLGRLEVYSAWAGQHANAEALNSLEREFIDASAYHHKALAAAERRRVRLLRRMVAALAVLVVLLLVAVGTSVLAYREAVTQHGAAAQARDEALSRRIAEEAARLRADDPGLAAQLALHAHGISPTREAVAAVLDSGARITPARVVGPPGAVTTAVRADGALAALGGSDGVVRLHRVGVDGLPDPAPTAQFRPQRGASQPPRVVFRPDGAVLAAGGDEGLALWQVSGDGAAAKVADLDAGAARVHDLAYSADGASMAAYTATGEVLRWDVADPARPVPLPPLPGQALPGRAPGSVAFAPGSGVLAVGGAPGQVLLWEVSGVAPRLLVELDLGAPTAVAGDVAFSPDGAVLAAASTNAEVRLWDVADAAAPRPLPAMTGFDGYVTAVGFHPDGRTLAAGGTDQAVRLWDYRAASSAGTVPGPAEVTALAFGASGAGAFGATVVVGSEDGVARFLPTAQPLLGSFGGPVFSLRADASRSRMLAAVGRGDRALHLLGADGRPLARLVPPDGATLNTRSAISADGTRVATATFEGDLFVWDVTDPARPEATGPLHPHEHTAGQGGHPHSFADVEFSPSGRALFAVDAQTGDVTVWDVADLASARVTGLIAGAGPTAAAALTPDGARLYVAGAGGQVAVWDVSDPARPSPLPAVTVSGGAVLSLAVSPDGGLLAVGGADHRVRLWDVSEPGAPQESADLAGPRGTVHALVFSPGGGALAAASGDKRLWLWDLSDPAEPSLTASLQAYGNRVNDVLFLADDVLVAGGYQGEVRRWSTDLDAVAARICATRGAPVTDAEREQYLEDVPHLDPCAG